MNLDLAYRIEEDVEVVDWKTGERESDKLQFVVYAIFANEVLDAPAGKIYLIEYNLLTDQKTIHKFGLGEIEETRDYINRSIAQMKSYLQDPAENRAEMTDFPRTEDRAKCDFCNFKKICFDLP